MNCDGGVDGLDIAGFGDCFLQGSGVVPGCECADMNLPATDGVLDEEEISLYVAALLEG